MHASKSTSRTSRKTCFPQPETPDGAALDRIVRAVGRFPPDLRREALAADLVREIDFYRAYRYLDSAQRRKAWTRIELIASAAKRIAGIAGDDELGDQVCEHLRVAAADVGREIGGYSKLGIEPDSFPALDMSRSKTVTVLIVHEDRAVNRVLDAVKLLARWADHAFACGEPGRRSISPEVGLIGITLPEVYEWHFKRRFRRGWTVDGKANSPGIRFIETVLSEFSIVKRNGKPYSATTIGTYWVQARLGRRRRRSVS